MSAFFFRIIQRHIGFILPPLKMNFSGFKMVLTWSQKTMLNTCSYFHGDPWLIRVPLSSSAVGGVGV